MVVVGSLRTACSTKTAAVRFFASGPSKEPLLPLQSPFTTRPGRSGLQALFFIPVACPGSARMFYVIVVPVVERILSVDSLALGHSVLLRVRVKKRSQVPFPLFAFDFFAFFYQRKSLI